MSGFVSKLLSNNLVEAKNELDTRIKELVNEKINQLKLRLAAEVYEGCGVEVDFVVEELSEGNILRMGRTKMIRVRIRRGKVQRRVKKSAVAGYVMRGGRLTRMTPMERRHRKMGARRSKFKRRAKLRQSLRKRRMSLRKRTAMGL
jgi:hypothetical protein